MRKAFCFIFQLRSSLTWNDIQKRLSNSDITLTIEPRLCSFLRSDEKHMWIAVEYRNGGLGATLILRMGAGHCTLEPRICDTPLRLTSVLMDNWQALHSNMIRTCEKTQQKKRRKAVRELKRKAEEEARKKRKAAQLQDSAIQELKRKKNKLSRKEKAKRKAERMLQQEKQKMEKKKNRQRKADFPCGPQLTLLIALFQDPPVLQPEPPLSILPACTELKQLSLQRMR